MEENLCRQNEDLHCDVLFTRSFKIRNWKAYNLSFLFYTPLILARMGKIEWCGCLPGMVLLKLSHIIKF